MLEVDPKICPSSRQEPDLEGDCHCKNGFVLGADGECLTSGEAAVSLEQWEVALIGAFPTLAFVAVVALLATVIRRLAVRRAHALPPMRFIGQPELKFLPGEIVSDEDPTAHSASVMVGGLMHGAGQRGRALDAAASSLIAEVSAVETGEVHCDGAKAVALALPASFWQLAHVCLDGRQVSVCPPLLFRDHLASSSDELNRGKSFGASLGLPPADGDLPAESQHASEEDAAASGSGGPPSGAHLVQIDRPAPRRSRSKLDARRTSVDRAHCAFRGRGHWAQRAFEWRATNVGDLHRARNERVLQLLGVCTLDHGLRVLVYEHCAIGTLAHLLEEETLADLSAREYARMADDVLLGCRYLHDLQPPVVAALSAHNVLVGSSFACKVRPELAAAAHGAAREHTWAAPELLEGGEPSKESDVYAVGIVLVEIFTGRPAYRKRLAEMARAGSLRCGRFGRGRACSVCVSGRSLAPRVLALTRLPARPAVPRDAPARRGLPRRPAGVP